MEYTSPNGYNISELVFPIMISVTKGFCQHNNKLQINSS